MSELKVQEIERMMSSENYEDRISALNLCKGREDIPIDVIKDAVNDECIEVHDAATDLLESMEHIPVDFLEELLHTDAYQFAISRLNNNPDLTIEKLKEWLYTEQEYYGTWDNITRERILSGICANRTDIPLEWYERELSEQEDCDVCLAAIKACKGRNDIPSSLIEIAKNHECEEVREAAEELMNSMNKQ